MRTSTRTEIGHGSACSFRVNVNTDARRRMRRLNIGRVFVDTPLPVQSRTALQSGMLRAFATHEVQPSEPRKPRHSPRNDASCERNSSEQCSPRHPPLMQPSYGPWRGPTAAGVGARDVREGLSVRPHPLHTRLAGRSLRPSAGPMSEQDLPSGRMRIQTRGLSLSIQHRWSARVQ